VLKALMAAYAPILEQELSLVKAPEKLDKEARQSNSHAKTKRAGQTRF